MEWIHEGQPPVGSRAFVWLDDGSVRRVTRGGFYGDLTFTDCTHDLQNVYCDPGRIKAWRLQEPQAPMPQPAQTSSEWGWLGSLFGL